MQVIGKSKSSMCVLQGNFNGPRFIGKIDASRIYRFSSILLVLFIILTFSALSSAAETAQEAPAAEKPSELDGMQQSVAQVPDPLAIVERDELDFLLLELRLNDLVLVEAITGFISGSSVILPLRDFATALDFPLSVDQTAGTAGGWFLKKSRLFSLDVSRGEVVIEGRIKKFNPALVEIHGEDIFVDIRLLSRWFPIDIGFDISNQTINLASREPLPVEQRMAREDYRARAFSGKTVQNADLPVHDVPFKIMDWPVIDIDTEFTGNKTNSAPTQKSASYSALMSGDLLYSNASLYVAGSNQQTVDRARLRLDRVDPEGNALGNLPLGMEVTEATAGDFFTPQLSEISRSTLGRGVMVTNVPIDTPNEFDKITLNGDLALGWEVELYRNEVLIGYESEQTDGQYTFEDVPLVFGVNVLRLIFYGPQGQEREEIRQIRVGPDQVSPGEIQYRMAASQHERPLLLRNKTAPDSIEGKHRLFAEIKTGISSNLSVGANYVDIPMEDAEAQRYATLTTSATLGNVYSRLDLVKQFNQGFAINANAQTSLFGVALIGEHSVYRDFFSEQVTNSSDPIRSSSALRLDGVVPETLIPRIPFSFTLNHDRYQSGDDSTKATNRLSTAVGPASVTNSLNYQITSNDNETTDTLSGNFLVGGRIGDFRVRGTTSYAVIPIKEVQSVGLTGDWTITPDYQGSAGVTHNLSETNPETVYSLGANTQFDLAVVGFNVDHSSLGTTEMKMTMSFSVGRDPHSGTLNVSKTSIADKGAAMAHVFLDVNANGTFDEGDEPLKGVKFMVDRRMMEGQTDENGNAYLTGLEAYRTTTLKVDRGTLEDPFWISSSEGVQMMPRPGSTAEVEFPIVSTSEIDGSVFRKWTDKRGEAAGVVVQLVNPDGSIARELRSAYDGFFLFDFVVPGTYTLRVDPAQLEKLGLKQSKGYTIVVDGSGTIHSGRNFTLSNISN